MSGKSILKADLTEQQFWKEYRQGLEAKEYVERRLAENDGQMLIETHKLGKWRRWLASGDCSQAPKKVK